MKGELKNFPPLNQPCLNGKEMDKNKKKNIMKEKNLTDKGKHIVKIVGQSSIKLGGSLKTKVVKSSLPKIIT